MGGSQKYCRGTFRNSWPPYFKENGGPLSGDRTLIRLKLQNSTPFRCYCILWTNYRESMYFERGENWEEKKENWKREGGKLKMEGGKALQNDERTFSFFFFFFFFAFHFSKPLKFVLGLPKWKFGVYQNGNLGSTKMEIWVYQNGNLGLPKWKFGSTIMEIWVYQNGNLGLPKWKFGSTKMEIFSREIVFHAGKKIRKKDNAPSEKFSCLRPW